MRVEWSRTPAGIRYRVQTDRPIWLHRAPGGAGAVGRAVEVTSEYETVLR
jgi:hypothetical protein